MSQNIEIAKSADQGVVERFNCIDDLHRVQRIWGASFIALAQNADLSATAQIFGDKGISPDSPEGWSFIKFMMKASLNKVYYIPLCYLQTDRLRA